MHPLNLFICLHVPAVAAIAALCGLPVAPATLVMGSAAVLASFAARRLGGDRSLRAAIAASTTLAGVPAAFAVALAAAGGAPLSMLGWGELGALDAVICVIVARYVGLGAAHSAEIERLDAVLQAKLTELGRLSAERDRLTTERDDAALRLEHLAHHDELTSLPNRVLMMERLDAVLAGRGDVVVLYLDLSDLRAVNETTGHASGDRALAIIAARIRRCIRAGDTASRVGGDEFVIVCASDNAPAESTQIAERLIAAVSEPIVAGAARMHLGANVGIAIAPVHGNDPDGLIRKAEAAMYRAKDSGANTCRLYEPAIHAELLERSTLRHDLEAAIARDEFVVHYQPIASMTSGAIIGAEALVRWLHPTRGLLAPSEFIPVAEAHGYIASIGQAVMDKACAQINRFALRTNDEFAMAVNVSALQIRDPGFVESVSALLRRHGIDSARLEIEITESVIMEDMKAVVARLHQLAALGVRLSIDDFGTGYSSLAYVKHFPVHTLKIDRSFVRDLADNPTDQAIATTIITLAHNLGMRVVAEGIESQEQFAGLRGLGADDMQGYLLSRPLPADDFERFVCAKGTLRLAA